MNLLLASMNQEYAIRKLRMPLNPSEERVKQIRFLNNLGFVEDAVIMVVAEHGGNLIVKIKDSRVAIGRELAKLVEIQE